MRRVTPIAHRHHFHRPNHDYEFWEPGRPLAYMITFSCYGTRLHGHHEASVDRNQNVFGTPFLEPNPNRQSWEFNRMAAPFELDREARQATVDAIFEVCAYRNWRLIVAHARTRHVHCVVQAPEEPERIMNDFKAYASRRLNSLEGRKKRRWSRHGSTLYLWTPEQLREKIAYAAFEQGRPLTLYWNGEWE